MTQRTANDRPRLAITLGDPNGIGPEIVLKCMRDADLRARIQPVLIGSKAVLRHHADVLGLSVDLMNTYMLNVTLLRWYKYEGIAK